MSFKWQTSLKMDELWLNSDREILGRAAKTAGKVGIILTLDLPNGQQFQAEVDKLSAETGSGYCQAARDYYDEWKASKEAASKRKQRDREQQAIVDSNGQEFSGEPDAGLFPVSETVQALEEAVQGATSLEEEVLRRVDAAYDARAKCNAELAKLTAKLTQCEEEIKQLEQMRSIFSASKVLEQASGSVYPNEKAPTQSVDNEPHSAEAFEGGTEGVEPSGSSD